MKRTYRVKVNGIWYPAGVEIPEAAHEDAQEAAHEDAQEEDAEAEKPARKRKAQ